MADRVRTTGERNRAVRDRMTAMKNLISARMCRKIDTHRVIRAILSRMNVICERMNAMNYRINAWTCAKRDTHHVIHAFPDRMNAMN
jgi:hypothetical protein